MRGWGRTPAGRRLWRKGTGVTAALGKGNNTRLPNPAKWKLSSEWWFPRIRPAHSPTEKRKTKLHNKRPTGVSLPGPAEEDEEILPAPARPRRPRTAPAHGAQRAGSRGAAPARRPAPPPRPRGYTGGTGPGRLGSHRSVPGRKPPPSRRTPTPAAGGGARAPANRRAEGYEPRVDWLRGREGGAGGRCLTPGGI